MTALFFSLDSRLRRCLSALLLCAPLVCASQAQAEGEAGILSLRAQGHFFVGAETAATQENGAVQVQNQMFVGFQLPAEARHPYPLVLVHGGGGQSTDWFSTPDGRDGWRDYFLAAGYDVYWVDRPGYGRSPTHKSYGELGESPNSGIISFLARSQHWPGNAANLNDSSILAWLASAPPGPYAGNEVATQGLVELLERIGPAILITHSAGAVTGWWTLDRVPDKVAGIIALEPGASNITSDLRNGLSFDPPLPADFQPVEDKEGCAMQPAERVSALPGFRGKPIRLVGSEMGLIAALPCAVKVFEQVEADVSYTYLPDLGLKGNGHFMMAESNNGEIAQVILDMVSKIK